MAAVASPLQLGFPTLAGKDAVGFPLPCFADRLRDVGVRIDMEVRMATEVAVQNAQQEARVLRDEVEWLQRKLEDELQQSAMRLSLCTDLKQRLGEMQDSLNHEISVREYWQNEATIFEERHSLLEAKLEALMLTHEEETGRRLGASCSPKQSHRDRHGEIKEDSISKPRRPSGNAAVAPAREETEVDLIGGELELAEVDLERYLCTLENEPSCGAVDKELKTLSVDSLHALLVAAVGRTTGSGALVQRIVQLWVSRLLARRDGLALQTVVKGGSAEVLATMLNLGGASMLTSSTLIENSGTGSANTPYINHMGDTDGEGCSPGLLDLCVECGNVSMLNVLLEHLRFSRNGLGLASVRQALALASANSAGTEGDAQELVVTLSSHLVVELSHLGNAQYRQGDLDGAISSYKEAIALCERSSALPAPMNATGKGEFVVGGRDVAGGHEVSGRHASWRHLPESARENLVRLHYNLARALHRSDRWAEAREQSTMVIAMDPAYVNAYALRAQAAMAAFDWEAAQADWDQLMAIVAAGTATVHLGSHAEKADLVATWRKRREECTSQLALGHYEVLGLPRIASLDEVRRAYRELARQWHPDKHRQRDVDLQDRATRRFERIRQAYEVLGDDATKHAYDATLLLCEARPLMTGHSAATSSLQGEKAETWSPENSDVPASCPSPFSRTLRNLQKDRTYSSDLDLEQHSRCTKNVRSELSDPVDRRVGGISTTRVATTDSPLFRRFSHGDSPSNRWVPSFRPSKCPASPQSGQATNIHPIHVNLFDAKFVNADSNKDSL